MGKRRSKEETEDLELKAEETADAPADEPVLEPVLEPDASTLLPPTPKAEPEPVADPKSPAAEGSRVVMGNAAVDPNRFRRGPVPMTAHVYCGIKRIGSPVNAGFPVWAKINGHTVHTREEWDAIFETYKTSTVR
jgi:hypothetical protein